MTALPQRTRIYRNHQLDSSRWDSIRFRPDDIVISTSIKAGTTWMQRIVSLLVFGPGPLPVPLSHVSPWIDQAFGGPIDPVVERLESQTHRRFLKSHLALDGLPYRPQVRYVMVGRDTRDVFMSLWNHYRAYTDEMYGVLDDAYPEGGPMPRCPADIKEFWRTWMTRGWFPWEQDGWPFWSHHSHASTFWSFRHLPNILLVHFADLLDDLETEMRRVAAFLEIDVLESSWPSLVEGARFDAMKAEGDQLLPGADVAWRGGTDTFFHKGTNGRWRTVLTDRELVSYETNAAQTLTPDLRSWLETGRSALAGDALP